ncbi:MAG: hypothetical protein H0T76_18790, partial [Nannocystis sp.]
VVLLALLGRSCAGGEPQDKAVVAREQPAQSGVASDPVATVMAAVLPGVIADDSVPAAFAEHAEVLLTASNRKQRRASAEAIANASEAEKQEIPGYLRNLAWLEKNQNCEAKKLVLGKIEAEADLRVIPGLRITAASRESCGRGWFKEDCLECMREDLARVLSRFETLAETKAQ